MSSTTPTKTGLAEFSSKHGIRFKADGNLLNHATGADVVAWLRLSPYGRVDLSLVEETLPDPAWVAERKGVGLRPRPGAVWALDFPVIATGEIDGTVLLRRGDSKQEASNVLLQLIGADGTAVQGRRRPERAPR